MSRNLQVFLVVTVFLVTSVVLIARDQGGQDAVETGSLAEIHEVDPGDAAMNAAMARARSTVDDFLQHLPELRSRGAFYTIKLPLSENGGTEHVWINEPDFDGERFTGYLANMPVSLPSWSYGDKVSVPADGISDWLAVADGTLYGGFTLHVLRPRMTEEELQAMTDGLGAPLPDQPALLD